MKVLFREVDPAFVGVGAIVFEWRPGGNHIALGGSTGIVYILDRYGQKAEEIRIGNRISFLNWDKDGEVLAIGSAEHSTVQLFELATRQVNALDVSMGTKGLPTYVEWSQSHPVLVIGNSHGNVMVFNYRTSKKLPLIGKHQRAIMSGAFSDDIFALGSDDLTVTINNLEGETLSTVNCSFDPSNLQMTRFKRNDGGTGKVEVFVSYIAGHKNFSVLSMDDAESPISLQFQERYGQIVDTCWFKQGMLVVAFENGFIVVLSAQNWDDVNHELFSVQEFHGAITSVHVNLASEKLFTAGDNGQVKVRNLNDLNELVDIVDSAGDAKSVTRVCCCDDGSLAAISTETPALIVYLTRISMITSTYRNKVAVLSSLTEVSIYEDGNMLNPLIFNAKLEPSILAIGHRHVAVVFNNRIWFYEFRKGSVTFICEEEYITTVNDVQLNKEFAMVVLERGIQLHPIINEDESDRVKMFPEDTMGDEKIVKANLLDKFLIYCTDKNRIRYFSLTDFGYAADYKHSRPITGLFGECNGIRSVFFDENYHAFLYHPADDEAYQFPDIQMASSVCFSTRCRSLFQYKSCLWETFTVDKDSLLLTDVTNMYTFVIARNSHGEQTLTHVGTVKIPYGNTPLSLSKGIVCCYTENGKLNTMLLSSHKTDFNVEGKTSEQLIELLDQSIRLKRWRNAWKLCERMADSSAFIRLGEAAMRELDLELAIRVFRHIGKANNVLALEALRGIEEENLLSGHVLSMLGEFDKADELFCLSSEPIRALEMRRNILDWDRALKLAKEIAVDQLPSVSLEYATQLEFMGQYSDALHYYEEAQLDPTAENDEMDSDSIQEHNTTCQAGIGRMLLKLGDVQKGVQIVMQIPGRMIKRDCGGILEQMKMFNEAAQLYETGQFYDRAAVAYIKAKNWTRIISIEDKVRSPKVLTQYGKLLMGDKKYEQAYNAFDRARSYDNMIVVLLRHLNRPDEAVKIARECRSSEGARMVAKFFTEIGDETSAIEFLVLSQCYQEAYDMALSFRKMDIYADALEEHGSSQQFIQLAEYFSTVKQNADAGRFYGLAKEYETALNFLMKAGDDEEAISNAIRFTAESNNSVLVDRLVHYLMGEPNSEPKDPKFLFQMYTRMGMHAKAAKIALIIAQEQQNRGSYRNAHALLFTMWKQLREQGIKPPTELEDWLMILHSYIIVKRHVQREDNLTAARLLIRVSKNEVPILTSTVITCAKANLRETAYKLASTLLRAPYKDKLDKKYKRKIETIVRKAGNVSDPEEVATACPQCGTSVAEFQLTCAGCKTTLPYCIVTGKHVISGDFSMCSSCRMPAFASELQRLHQNAEPCPMCNGEVGAGAHADVKDFLRQPA